MKYQFASVGFRQLVSVEFSDLIGISEKDIDWKAVNKRVQSAIWEAGLVPDDLFEVLGLDSEADDFWQELKKLPKIKTTMTVANFLGVPASWLLTGKGFPPGTSKKAAPALQPGSTQGACCTTDSTIIQGNSASHVVVNYGSPDMSAQKRELMRIFDSLPLRKQTRLLCLAYEMEDSKISS